MPCSDSLHPQVHLWDAGQHLIGQHLLRFLVLGLHLEAVRELVEGLDLGLVTRDGSFFLALLLPLGHLLLNVLHPTSRERERERDE